MAGYWLETLRPTTLKVKKSCGEAQAAGVSMGCGMDIDTAAKTLK